MAKKKPWTSKYHGITHNVLIKNLPKWKREKCSKNIHAFDEVSSLENHHLVCDACGLLVEIKKIDTQYMNDPMYQYGKEK